MEVIFLADVPGSGLAGEVKRVKNGYARNFLIPRRLAVVATHDQLQRIEGIRKAAAERRLKEAQDLRLLAEHLTGQPVSLTAKMGPTGRFYGAVTSAHISEELSRLTQREFDRRTVHLEQPIHEPGEYQAEVRFPHGITATLQVMVKAEGAEETHVKAQEETQTDAESPLAEEGPSQQDE